MQNHYDILGVSRDSSQEDIKRAYRKKAAELHPDRNTAADATEKMAAVNIAYEVLSDEQKRQIHNDELDGKRRNPFDGGGGSPFAGNPNDIFDFFNVSTGYGGVNVEELFNFFARGSERKRQQGPNVEISLTFKDVLLGKSMDIEIPVHFPCLGCLGHGFVVGGEVKNCETCKGSGRVAFRQGGMAAFISCNKCSGQGKTNRTVCTRCSGQGATEQKVQTGINIPCGMRDGNVMEYTVTADGRQTKAYIAFSIEPHPVFHMFDNGNIGMQLTINYPTAVLGKTVQIETLDGRIHSVKVPVGAQTGTTMRITGVGLPRGVGSKTLGDLLLQIDVEIPKNLTTAQKEALEKFQFLLENKQ